jgi:hypothetical protein
VPRGNAGAGGGGGARATGGASSGDGSATATPSGGTSSPAVSERRGAGRDGSQATSGGRRDGDNGVPDYARPRDGRPAVGTAVPRGSVPSPPATGGGIYVPGGYYGQGGYYGGYYGAGYGYYDPWGGIGGFAGYYGGYYDPWYGGYPADPQGGGGYTNNFDDGTLRLKIKPRDAEVYVDGYYSGLVDDFDGMFQRLHLDAGPHRIEVRANGYEPLTFEVRITPDHTTTYQGEMKRLQ